MSNWKLAFALVVLCIPGILLFIPSIKIFYEAKSKLTNKILSLKKLNYIVTLQNFILVIIAAFLGTAINQKINLHAPFIESVVNNQASWTILKLQILPAIIFGISNAFIFLIAYYLIIRSHLEKYTVHLMENLFLSMGLLGRIFYSGIVEEVIYRWGLMSLLIGIGFFITGQLTQVITWSAMICSGFLLGLINVFTLSSLGCKKSLVFVLTTFIISLWTAVIFGWLFWQYGLETAIMAHIILQIVWFATDFMQVESVKKPK